MLLSNNQLQLLECNHKKRLADQSEIKKHPFFASINWDKLARKGVPPPHITTKQANDASMMDICFLKEVFLHHIFICNAN